MAPAAVAFGLYCLWCGFVWRLRGGALATLIGVRVGTQVTRVICCMLIGSPLAAAHATTIASGAVAGALFGGMVEAGWGPFQGMGLAAPGVAPEASWMRALPLLIGLRVGTFWHDFVGMAQAGLMCMAGVAIVCGIVTHWAPLSIVAPLAAGAAFPVAYALARLRLPTIPNFAAGQSWGEVGAGILVGAALGFVFIL